MRILTCYSSAPNFSSNDNRHQEFGLQTHESSKRDNTLRKSRKMPHQDRYNTRSTVSRGFPSEYHQNHHQDHSSSQSNRQSYTNSSSTRSLNRYATSSYNYSGRDIIHPYDTQHDRCNNHDECYSRDNPSPTRWDRDLNPDANAPYGYRLNSAGGRTPLPNPDELHRVQKIDGTIEQIKRSVIDSMSGYWAMTPNGTEYFQCTPRFEARTIPLAEFCMANRH